jgi:uncharacterized protein
MSAAHTLELPIRSRERRNPLASTADAIRRHPLLAFFAFAYALSWWPSVLYLLTGWGSPIFGCGPFLAAIVVLSLTRGKPGLKQLFRSMLKWRVAPRWWAVAILLPIAVTLAAAGMNIALGAQVPNGADLGRWTSVLPTAVVILLVPLFGGAWEEPGWRGYALPRLLARRSALEASLILGSLWALWHVPLFLTGKQHWSDLLLVVTVCVVLTWLFQNVLGSVLVTMVFHAINNAFSGGYVSQMFTGKDSVRQSWMLVIAWAITAVLVVSFGRTFRRPR